MIEVSFRFKTDDPSICDVKDPACLENIADLFHGIVLSRLEAKTCALARETELGQEYLKWVDRDIALAKEIFKSIQIKEVD